MMNDTKRYLNMVNAMRELARAWRRGEIPDGRAALCPCDACARAKTARIASGCDYASALEGAVNKLVQR